MAEAENWSRLSKEALRGEADAKPDEGGASRPVALGRTFAHVRDQ
jgi:hypothetical protein